MKKHSRRSLLAAVFLNLVLGATVLVSPAAASHVACGDVITQDTVLDSNIGPCTGDGVVIGADNITLDLNGHRIFGTEVPGEGAGVLLDGRSGVRVVNGTVSNFDAGVAILGGSGNAVSGVAAIANVGSGDTDFGDGIAVGFSSGNRIFNNRVVDNGPFSGIAVFGAGSTNNTIDGNEIVGNAAVDITDSHHGDPSGTQQTDGVRLEPRTLGNTVTNNVVRGSGLDGIAVFAFSTDNVVRGNDVRGNGFHDKTHRKGSGIILFARADRNLIEGNTVIGNAANGIVLRGPVGTITGARFNQVLNNTTRGNAVLVDPQTTFYDLRDDNFNPPCDDNVWRGNTYKTFNQPCVTQ